MSVRFDIGAALRVARQAELLPGALDRVEQRATSTLTRRLKAEAGRAVPARFNVAPKLVRDRLRVVNEGRGVVALIGSGKPLELRHFGGEYGGRLTPGASAQILVGGERRTRKGSFVRKSDGRTGQILTRAESKRSIGQRVQRLPIKTEYGPDVGSMLLSGQVGSELAQFGQRILADEVARLVAVELKAP